MEISFCQVFRDLIVGMSRGLHWRGLRSFSNIVVFPSCSQLCQLSNEMMMLIYHDNHDKQSFVMTLMLKLYYISETLWFPLILMMMYM